MKKLSLRLFSPAWLIGLRQVLGVLLILFSLPLLYLSLGAAKETKEKKTTVNSFAQWKERETRALTAALNGKENELESFRLSLSEASLTPQQKEVLAREVTLQLSQVLWDQLELARQYSELDPHHPYLERLREELRKRYRLFGIWFDQTLSLLPSGERDSRQRKERHWLAYTKGVLAGWLAELEPDLESKRTLWTDSVESHIEALNSQPGDLWTRQNLEILEKRFTRKWGFGKDAPKMRASRGALGQKELSTPLEGKTRGQARPPKGFM